MVRGKFKNHAEHYKWGDNCDGWHLLKSDTLSVIRERMPPGTSEKTHFHFQAQQLFYILSGTANFNLDGNEFKANEHDYVHVPKGVIHSVHNLSDEPLEFLVISEPKSHEDKHIINQA